MARPASTRKTSLCWTGIRRTASAELLDLLSLLTDVIGTRGWALLWNRSAPTFTSYSMAVYRLQKAGLIARRRNRGQTPFLLLTHEGESRISDILRPERWWNQRWDGYWHVLSYDVPEKNRNYRRALQGFLHRMRMGLLHRSVWISCRDVRPAFLDLKEAASLQDFAVLLEARTVLGQTGRDLAGLAWNFDALQTRQSEYIQACARRTATPLDPNLTPADLMDVMRQEQAAYENAMRSDPLLPRELWPSGYQGPAVVAAFRGRIAALATHL
jgi:phenylacetic acid degradation operon negative regulatory protein